MIHWICFKITLGRGSGGMDRGGLAMNWCGYVRVSPTIQSTLCTFELLHNNTTKKKFIFSKASTVSISMMKLMDLNCRLCKLENKHSLPVGTLKIKRKGQVEKKCNSEAILLPQFPNTLENRSKKLGTPSLGQIPSQQSILLFLWAAPRSQRGLPGHQYIPPGN